MHKLRGVRTTATRLGVSLSLGWGLAFSLGALALSSCADASQRGVERYDRQQLADRLADPGESELVIGVFPLKKGAIVDGDTVKVGGLDGTLRLLALDTEETFKSETAKRAYEQGWETYLRQEQAKTSRPVKIPTPLGEDAKHYAKDFFKGVQRVRLERDHPKEIRGRFNRFLAYVFVEKDGEWVNFNLESVRAGMSPYFTKYAYSRRFHADFVAAQNEARAAKRGIWAPGGEHYDDYPTRLAWWDARADFIQRFEREAEGREDMIVLTHWDATRRLAGLLDREVEVLATVGSIRMREGKSPTRVMLSRRMFADMPLIFWDDETFKQSHIGEYKGEFVRVKGLVTQYVNKYTGRAVLQIEVRLPRQVTLAPYIPPGKDAAVRDREVDRSIAPTIPAAPPSREPEAPPPETVPDAPVPTLDAAPETDASSLPPAPPAPAPAPTPLP